MSKPPVMMPARVDSLRRILKDYGRAALVSHLTDDEAAYLLTLPAILRGLSPCQHPERIKHGRHEWYIDVIGGGDGLCRACGAVCAGAPMTESPARTKRKGEG